MRKITRQAQQAWVRNQNFKSGNTKIVNGTLYLFSNKIAWKCDNKVFFTLAGWNTKTTRERLQAVGVSVSTKNFIPHYNGQEIDIYEVYEVK